MLLHGVGYVHLITQLRRFVVNQFREPAPSSSLSFKSLASLKSYVYTMTNLMMTWLRVSRKRQASKSSLRLISIKSLSTLWTFLVRDESRMEFDLRLLDSRNFAACYAWHLEGKKAFFAREANFSPTTIFFRWSRFEEKKIKRERDFGSKLNRGKMSIWGLGNLYLRIKQV